MTTITSSIGTMTLVSGRPSHGSVRIRETSRVPQNVPAPKRRLTARRILYKKRLCSATPRENELGDLPSANDPARRKRHLPNLARIAPRIRQKYATHKRGKVNMAHH